MNEVEVNHPTDSVLNRFLFTVSRSNDTYEVYERMYFIGAEEFKTIIEMLNDSNKALLNIKAENDWVRLFAMYIIKNRGEIEKYDIITFRAKLIWIKMDFNIEIIMDGQE
jgi:hypothetical protein